MRISELSRLSGTPIATVKFYLREKLLPAGTAVGRNQAEYSEGHLRRILFIRALTNVGQLDLASVRQIIEVIEEDQATLAEVYASVDRNILPMELEPNDSPLAKETDTDVADLIERLGWKTDPSSPGYNRFLTVLVTLRRLGCGSDIDYFASYAEAAERLMAQELDLLPADVRGPERGGAVARTILLGIAMTSLSSMAVAHLLAQREQPALAHGRAGEGIRT